MNDGAVAYTILQRNGRRRVPLVIFLAFRTARPSMKTARFIRAKNGLRELRLVAILMGAECICRT